MESPWPSNPFLEDRLNRSSNYRPEWDVPSLNADLSRQLLEVIDGIRDGTSAEAARKIPALLGTPGYGKTHLFGRLAYQRRDQVLFVFVPQLEEKTAPVDHV